MIDKARLQRALLATAAAGALSFGLGTSPAHALPTISSQIFYGSENTISDNDAETLIDNFSSDSGATGTNGFINVGDVLSGVISWNTSASGSNTGAFGGLNSNEFTGIFQIEVTSRTLLSDGLDGIAGTADDFYGFTFGPTASFTSIYGAGAMVALYEDTNGNENNVRSLGSQALDIAAATDTTLVWVWGFSGDLDEQWVAVGPQGPSVLTTSTSNAVFNYQLSSLFASPSLFPTGLSQVAAGCSGTAFVLGLNANPCLPLGGPADGDGLIDINGSGNVVGPGSGSDWPIWSNTDATFFPNRLSEPSTLSLVGLGLIGLGFMGRRRKARKA